MDIEKLRNRGLVKNSRIGSKERISAYDKALADGRVREFSPGKGPPPSLRVAGFNDDGAIRMWNLDPDLRSEFNANRDAYLAYARAVADGRTEGRRLD